jgi:hypothetical protein
MKWAREATRAIEGDEHEDDMVSMSRCPWHTHGQIYLSREYGGFIYSTRALARRNGKASRVV